MNVRRLLRRRRSDGGSLLLEAVVALAVSAILFGSFAQSSISATSVQRTAQYEDIAIQAAQGAIEQTQSATWSKVGFTGTEAGYTATGRDGKRTVKLTGTTPTSGLAPTRIVTVNKLRVTLNTNVTWATEPAASGSGDFGVKAITVQAKWTEISGKTRSVEVRSTRTPSIGEAVPSDIANATGSGVYVYPSLTVASLGFGASVQMTWSASSAYTQIAIERSLTPDMAAPVTVLTSASKSSSSSTATHKRGSMNYFRATALTDDGRSIMSNVESVYAAPTVSWKAPDATSGVVSVGAYESGQASAFLEGSNSASFTSLSSVAVAGRSEVPVSEMSAFAYYRVRFAPTTGGSVFSDKLTRGSAPTVGGTPPPATIGAAYSYTLTSTGSPSFAVTAGALPAGLTLNAASGVISGTPTTAGARTFTVKATNGLGSVTQDFTITAGAAPTLSGTFPAGTSGTPYGSSPGFTGAPTFAITSGALPAGLSLTTSSGVVSGTPTGTGSSSFTITATNAFGTDSQAYSISVAAIAAPSGFILKNLLGNTAVLDWNSVSNVDGYRLTYTSTNGKTSGTVNVGAGATAGVLPLSTDWTGTVTVQAVKGTFTATKSGSIPVTMPSDRISPGSLYKSSAGATGQGPTAVTDDSGITSPDGRFSAVMQSDGNFVVYENANAFARGATMTVGRGARVSLRTDGNLVLYDSSSSPVASTGSSGANSTLRMQSDGNLVVYNGSGVATWAMTWQYNFMTTMY